MHRSARTIMHHVPLSHEMVIQKLGLAPGMIVADVGAGGGGRITMPVARHVRQGMMIAHDIQPTRLNILRDSARLHGVHNIEYVVGDVEQSYGLPVDDSFVDAIMMINTLHQLNSKKEALAECARALVRGGTMLIVDWDTRKTYKRHALDQYLITPEDVNRLVDEVGLTHIDTFHVKPYYWGMLLEAV